MVPADLDFIRRLLASHELTGPVLELGGGYGGDTCREAVQRAGLEYVASDMHSAPGVDIVLNFEDDAGAEAIAKERRFGSVLILNVLEHTFEPTKILDNALKLLEPGGTLVVITPITWALHDYPKDFVRLMPHWYERYAESRKLELLGNWFEYVGSGPVRDFVHPDGQLFLPPPRGSKAKRTYSKVIHKLFNTTGRSFVSVPYEAVGAVFRKS
jgi:SAM-dependent methyltransferase